MIMKLIRLGRRQLHTIISREIIKPTSPIPFHIHTYNLSSLDQLIPPLYMPLVLFYHNKDNCSTLTPQDKAKVLKKSLSQTLTRYYPFAGRFSTPTTSYVDCNDEGVVFVEATIDSQLDSFKHDHATDLDQLFADDMVCFKSPGNTSLVGVQLNHFACGGLGLAVSMSHRIGDGCTLASFLNHWASVARYGSTEHKEVLPLNPNIIQFPCQDSIHPAQAVDDQDIINQLKIDRVMRIFVFSNSKLSELKNKVISTAAGSTLAINNPTRVESLSALLYKTAMKATYRNHSCFNKPSYLIMPVDIRNRFVQKLPQTTVGNIWTSMMVTTRHTNEGTSLNMMVAEIRKAKMRLERIQSVQHAVEISNAIQKELGNEDIEIVAKTSYFSSSICGFPYNKVDFGWGKATGATLAMRSVGRNGFVMMDTQDGDGIEVMVVLEKQDMEIFENDKEMLSFCKSN